MKHTKRFASIILVLSLLAVPALAGEKLILKASGAQVAPGSGLAVEIGNYRSITVVVNVTAGSGTVNPFRVWLEVSPDGSTFFESPCIVLKTGAAAPGAWATQRDIVNEAAVQTSAKYLGICETYASIIRIAWNIAGSTPSETFDVVALAK